jgi:hypothetical protein
MQFRLDWFGDDVKSAVKAAERKALQTAGEAILTESNQRVPHDEGALERSGTVEVDEDGQGIVAVVSYDGPYARRWHEQPANFQKGRRHKYLESALNDRGQQALDHARAEIARVLG